MAKLLTPIDREILESFRTGWKTMQTVVTFVTAMGYTRKEVDTRAMNLQRGDLLTRKKSNGIPLYRLNAKLYAQQYPETTPPVPAPMGDSNIPPIPEKSTFAPVSKEDPIPLAIWKVMSDGHTYTVIEVGLLLEVVGFNNKSIERTISTIHSKNGWFTRTGKGVNGDPFKYTLKPTAKMPEQPDQHKGALNEALQQVALSTQANLAKTHDETKGDYDGDNGFKITSAHGVNGVVVEVTENADSTKPLDIFGDGKEYKVFPDLMSTLSSTEDSVTLLPFGLLTSAVMNDGTPVSAAELMDINESLGKLAKVTIAEENPLANTLVETLNEIFPQRAIASVLGRNEVLKPFEGGAVDFKERLVEMDAGIFNANGDKMFVTFTFKEMIEIHKSLRDMDIMKPVSTGDGLVKTNFTIDIGEVSLSTQQCQQLYKEISYYLHQIIGDVYDMIVNK